MVAPYLGELLRPRVEGYAAGAAHQRRGAPLAARYMASKKGEISTSCEKLFAGEAITEAETKDAALAWVPDAMRFDLVSVAGADEAIDDEPGDEGFDDDDYGDTDDLGADDAGIDSDEALIAAE